MTDARKFPKPGSQISEEDFKLLLEVVQQVAGFLQRPADLEKAVAERFNPIPEDWLNILEMLPKEGVLVEQDGKMYWRYDYFGKPQTLPEAKRPEGVGLEPELQPEVRRLGATVSEVAEAIDRVREVENAVRQYTEERLNLDRLAVELRLLNTSPPHSAFAVSSGNYLGNVGLGPQEFGYPSLSTDRMVIEEFFNLIS